MGQSPEQPIGKEGYENEVLLAKIDKGLIEIFGEQEAKEHIDFIRELESLEAGINYIYGVLLERGHTPEEFLVATGVLEPDGDAT